MARLDNIAMSNCVCIGVLFMDNRIEQNRTEQNRTEHKNNFFLWSDNARTKATVKIGCKLTVCKGGTFAPKYIHKREFTPNLSLISRPILNKKKRISTNDKKTIFPSSLSASWKCSNVLLFLPECRYFDDGISCHHWRPKINIILCPRRRRVRCHHLHQKRY